LKPWLKPAAALQSWGTLTSPLPARDLPPQLHRLSGSGDRGDRGDRGADRCGVVYQALNGNISINHMDWDLLEIFSGCQWEISSKKMTSHVSEN